MVENKTTSESKEFGKRIIAVLQEAQRNGQLGEVTRYQHMNIDEKVLLRLGGANLTQEGFLKKLLDVETED